MDGNAILGYFAASASILAFGSQFVYTLKSQTTAGLSLSRSAFDTVSLVLWLGYAARVDDIPLLIATATELFTCVGVLVLIIKSKRHVFSAVKDYTPPPTPPDHSEEIRIDVRSARRASI
jgi:uncharacterized protein with PQ loop repeat